MPRLPLPQSPSQLNSMQLILPTESYEPDAAEAPPAAVLWREVYTPTSQFEVDEAEAYDSEPRENTRQTTRKAADQAEVGHRGQSHSSRPREPIRPHHRPDHDQ